MIVCHRHFMRRIDPLSKANISFLFHLSWRMRAGLGLLKRPAKFDIGMAAFTINLSKSPFCQSRRAVHVHSQYTPCRYSFFQGDLSNSTPLIPFGWYPSTFREGKRHPKNSVLALAKSLRAGDISKGEQTSQGTLKAWHAVKTVLFNFTSKFSPTEYFRLQTSSARLQGALSVSDKYVPLSRSVNALPGLALNAI